MQEIIRVSDVEKYYGNGDQVTKAVDRVRKNNAFKSVVNH